MLLANKEGIIVTGAIVNMAAAAPAGSVLVFSVPVLANQLVGLKSVKIRKVMMHNNAAGTTTVTLGNGAVGVGIPAILPALDTINNMTQSYVVGLDFPEVESFANIVAWPAALVALGTIDIQLEVAVIG
jgi:hypothetical protein